MLKQIRFIVNPFSGLGRQKTLRTILEKELDPKVWKWQISNTKFAGHATELSRESIGNFDIVVAVGGDGTVNEVASGLIGSTITMGIIPAGSGNGLARHLNIPLKVNRAVQMLGNSEIKAIDSILIGNKYSFNVSGIGFDGHISHLFAKEKKRGPMGYIKLITQEFPKYKSQIYEIEVDGNNFSREAFLISFANTTQYGNNAYISPNAKVDDGLCDVCIIADFPKMEAPALLISLFDQSIDQTKYDEIIRGKRIVVKSNELLQMHIDGEPVIVGNEVELKMLPLSLNILVPTADFLIHPIIAQFQNILPTISSFSLGNKKV